MSGESSGGGLEQSLILFKARVPNPRPGKLYCASRNQVCKLCTFIHLLVCLTIGPKPFPKRAVHRVRSRASSFKWHPVLSLRSSSSFLRHLPRLSVTSIPPFIFSSTTCCRRQFLRKMWPIQLALVYLFHVGYSSVPWLEVILHFSHDRYCKIYTVFERIRCTIYCYFSTCGPRTRPFAEKKVWTPMILRMSVGLYTLFY